jgi:hypothetical protein
MLFNSTHVLLFVAIGMVVYFAVPHLIMILNKFIFQRISNAQKAFFQHEHFFS